MSIHFQRHKNHATLVLLNCSFAEILGIYWVYQAVGPNQNQVWWGWGLLKPSLETGLLYILYTINKYQKLVDVDKDATINLKDETLTFKGKSENKEYELDIVFFKPVDSEGSTYKVLPRSVVMHVMKKEKDDEEFWPRLLKDKTLEKNRVSAQYSFCMFSYCNVTI